MTEKNNYSENPKSEEKFLLTSPFMKRLCRPFTFKHNKTVMTEHQNHLRTNKTLLISIFLLSFMYSIIDIVSYIATDEDKDTNYVDLMFCVVFQFLRLVLFFFYIHKEYKEFSKKFLYIENAFIVVFLAGAIATWNMQISLDPSRAYIVGVEAGWTFLYVHTLFGQWPWKAVIYISTSIFAIYKVSMLAKGFSIGVVQAILQMGFVLVAAFIEERRKRKKLLHSLSLEKTEQTLRNILNSLPDNIAILNLQGDIRFYNDFFGISFKLTENMSSAGLFSQIFQVKPRERNLNVQKIQDRYNFIKSVPKKFPKPHTNASAKSIGRDTLVKSSNINGSLIRYLTQELEFTNSKSATIKGAKDPKDQARPGIERAGRFSRITSLKTLTEYFGSVPYFRNLQEVLDFFCINADIIRTYSEKEKSFFIFDAKYNTSEGVLKSFEIKISMSMFDDEESFILILRDTTHRDIIVTLEDNNNFKDSVLSSLSHELRTPLNTNLNLLQLAIDAFGKLQNKTTLPSTSLATSSFAETSSIGLITDLKDSYLIPAHKSGKLLESLINDVVDYSMLLARKFVINMKQKYLIKSLDKIRYLCEFQARKKNLEFHISLSQELNFKIGTDHRRLRQILTNLLNNAIRFTNKGFISLRIEPYCENPNLILFSVKDSGIGISKENLERMSNLLDSGNYLNKLNMESSGVGMGLIISQMLAKEIGPTAQRMSGIKIESTEDEGSKFWFIVENWMKVPENPVRKISEWGRMQQFKSGATVENNNNDSSRLSAFRRPSVGLNQLTMERSNLTIGFEPVSRREQNLKDGNLAKEDEMDDEIAKMIKDDNLKINLGDGPFPKRNSQSPVFASKNLNSFMNGSSGVNSAAMPDKKFPETTLTIKTLNFDHHSRFLRGQTQGQESTEIREDVPRACICPEILVVDDDMFNLFTMENLLATLKFHIVKATNGEEAIKLVKKRDELKCSEHCSTFKIIFMDLSMPVMDGFEATKRLKAMMKSREIDEIPIVACTAFVDKDKTDKCYECGMEGRISKPVNKNKLREVLKKYKVIQAEDD